MRDPDVGQLTAGLDAILRREGFASGQYGQWADASGVGVRRTQVIFCAGHDDLSDRHPRLPQADDQPRGQGACIDLVVDIDEAGALAAIRLEGLGLVETLRAVSLDTDADALTAVLGSELADAVPAVEAAVAHLFAPVGPRGFTG